MTHKLVRLQHCNPSCTNVSFHKHLMFCVVRPTIQHQRKEKQSIGALVFLNVKSV